MRPPLAFALGSSLLVSACGAPPVERVTSSTEPIVNGEVAVGDPSVVALTTQGQVFCTGSLVAPRVVVTAAHCVDFEKTPIPLDDVEVYFGQDVDSGEDELIGVEMGVVHPGYVTDAPLYDLFDVAVLLLATASASPPIALPTEPLDYYPSRAIRFVGFGITEGGGNDSGVKREGTGEVLTALGTGTTFLFANSPAGTCYGDSGGPTFFEEGGQEILAGIHAQADCEEISLDERVDLYVADFIQPFIDAVPIVSCDEDGQCATGCRDPDLDCPCASDGHCTAACADVASDPDCDPGCVANGVCVANCPKPDPDCVVCELDGMCDPTCATDPDCSPSEPCFGDNCLDTEENGGDASGASDDGGCSTSGGRNDRGASVAWALLLLGAVTWRRSLR